MKFSFDTIVISEVVKEEVKRTSVAVSKNPDGMKLRLFKDGSIYPSFELVQRFNLEYPNREEAELARNGFDVVDSRSWTQYPQGADNYIFICATPKDQAKVDLFANVRYKEDGAPTSSVLTQGSKRPELIEMIREVYNLGVVSVEDVDQAVEVDKLFGESNYVDLEVHTDVVLPTTTNIFHLPKRISRGPKVGQLDTVRRENSVFNPLTVVSNNVEEEVEVNSNEDSI